MRHNPSFTTTNYSIIYNEMTLKKKSFKNISTNSEINFLLIVTWINSMLGSWSTLHDLLSYTTSSALSPPPSQHFAKAQRKQSKVTKHPLNGNYWQSTCTKDEQQVDVFSIFHVLAKNIKVYIFAKQNCSVDETVVLQLELLVLVYVPSPTSLDPRNVVFYSPSPTFCCGRRGHLLQPL